MAGMICEICKGGHGAMPVMRKTVEQVFKAGASQPEVVKYVCSFCGSKEGTINTHKDPISIVAINSIMNNQLALVNPNNVVISGYNKP